MQNIRRDRGRPFALAGFVVGVLLLAACQGGEDVADDAPEPAATPEAAKTSEGQEVSGEAPAGECGTGELALMPTPTPNAPISFYQDVATQFEETHPGITVEVQEAPGPVGPYLLQLAATGDLPDVFLGSSANPDSFPGENPLQPIPLDADIEDLPNVEDQLHDGNLYSIPGYLLPSGLVFYNTAMFEDAGIESEPKTLDEFEDAMAQLSEAGHTPMIMGGDWSLRVAFLELAMPNVFQDNPDWYADRREGSVQFADGEWLEFSQRFQSWVEDGYVHRGALDLDYTGAQQVFLAGDAAMYPMASYFTRAAGVGDEFEVGVFQTPTEGGERVLATNYVGWSIAKDSEYPDAALCLAKYLSIDRDLQATIMDAEGWFSNLVPPVEIERQPLEDEIAGFVAESQHVPGETGWGDISGPGAFRAELEPALQGLVGGGMVAADAMAGVDRAWDSSE